MIDQTDVLLRRRVLVVDDALRHAHTAVGRAVSGLVAELTRRGVEVTESVSYEDGAAVIASDAGLCAVLVDWALANGSNGEPDKPGEQASRLLALIRSRNATLPIFLLAGGNALRGSAGPGGTGHEGIGREGFGHGGIGHGDAGQEITIEAMEHADELVWVLQDTADFIAGRVLAAMDRYVNGLLPPFFRALLEYNREQEYAWAVPGHQGGVAYLKTPVGRMFHDFYGENLFRTDMGIERVSLGSLLDHTGPIGASEAYAARVFGAHRTYSGLVGTSGSNRAVMSAVLSSGDIAVIDRNCHKSVMQGLQITGAVPVYLIPSRNRYGIIGPIRPEEMTPASIQAKIAASPLVNAQLDVDARLEHPAGGLEYTAGGIARRLAGTAGGIARPVAGEAGGIARPVAGTAGGREAERAPASYPASPPIDTAGGIARPGGGTAGGIARPVADTAGGREAERAPASEASSDPASPRGPESEAKGPRAAQPDATAGGPEGGGSGGLVFTPRENTAKYAVITNCTYDGLCYDAAAAQAMLEQTTDVVHFDEAWYGYARFHPLYQERFAMRGDPAAHPKDGPTVFSTQSSHKLLAALSQASFIHVREGRRKIPHGAFNEAYMMHATTSPLYALIAANDVAASMMDGPGGQALVQETIDEAVAFRQTLARAHRQFTERGDWFFAPWNAPEVTDPATGRRMPFADAPADLLRSEPECWVLHPDEAWHGFGGIDDGWCMLDPTKAGILAPGMGDDGELGPWGVPATLLTAYLGRHGIVPSRTTDHIVLCLFSVGITRGKWGTLLNALLAFKRDWDANAPLAAVLPDVLAADRRRYAGIGLRDLGEQMWAHLRAEPPAPALQAAFASVPEARMTPREAYERLVRGDVELVPFAEMAGRTLAVGIQPYPPGIPILLPGEDAGPVDGPFLSYLRLLQDWDAAFPGFEHEVEGAEHIGAAHDDAGQEGDGQQGHALPGFGPTGSGHLVTGAVGGGYAAYCVARDAALE